jgi:hypothetical protein
VADGPQGGRYFLQIFEMTAVGRFRCKRAPGTGKDVTEDLATVHLTLLSPAQPIPGDDESVASRIRNAWSSALSLGVSTVTAGIVAAGVLVPLSLPLLLVFALVRWRRRRLSAPLAVG